MKFPRMPWRLVAARTLAEMDLRARDEQERADVLADRVEEHAGRRLELFERLGRANRRADEAEQALAELTERVRREAASDPATERGRYALLVLLLWMASKQAESDGDEALAADMAAASERAEELAARLEARRAQEQQDPAPPARRVADLKPGDRVRVSGRVMTVTYAGPGYFPGGPMRITGRLEDGGAPWTAFFHDADEHLELADAEEVA